MTAKTLEDWRSTINEERRHVDRKPYSHNIITIALGAIAKGWGQAEANKAIRDFKLNQLGWSEHDEVSS